MNVHMHGCSDPGGKAAGRLGSQTATRPGPREARRRDPGGPRAGRSRTVAGLRSARGPARESGLSPAAAPRDRGEGAAFALGAPRCSEPFGSPRRGGPRRRRARVPRAGAHAWKSVAEESPQSQNIAWNRGKRACAQGMVCRIMGLCNLWAVASACAWNVFSEMLENSKMNSPRRM